MRKRRIINGYSNCYEGECLFCHDVTCMVEQGYQDAQLEVFTPEDYKNHITDLAGLIVNEGANGLIKHFGTLINLNDPKLTNWAVKNCSDEAALAQFAKHMPYAWKASPYSSEIDFLLSKINNQSIIEDLVLWAESMPGEEKLLSCATDRLEEIEKAKYIPYHKGFLDKLMAGDLMKYDDEYEFEYDDGADEEYIDEYEEYYEYEDHMPESSEKTQEELFADAKNYMDIDNAEKAVYQLTDDKLLRELAEGAW